MVTEEYQIEVLPVVVKELQKLPADVQRKLSKKIDALASKPRPEGCEKIKGREHTYRVRVGDYRIIYEVYDKRLVVLIVDAGHRREIYRDY